MRSRNLNYGKILQLDSDNIYQENNTASSNDYPTKNPTINVNASQIKFCTNVAKQEYIVTKDQAIILQSMDGTTIDYAKEQPINRSQSN